MHSKAVITFMLPAHVMAATDTGVVIQRAPRRMFHGTYGQASTCHYPLSLIPAAADWGYNPSYSCAEDVTLVDSVRLHFAANGKDITLLEAKFKD